MSDMLTIMAEARWKEATGMTFDILDEEEIQEEKRAMAAALRKMADAVHGDDEMSDQHAIVIRDWLSYQAEQAP